MMDKSLHEVGWGETKKSEVEGGTTIDKNQPKRRDGKTSGMGVGEGCATNNETE